MKNIYATFTNKVTMTKTKMALLTIPVFAAIMIGATVAPANAGGLIIVSVDIKPGSCPNPINVNSNGLLPVAILGTAEFDVNNIDISTLPARTQMHKIEDVATPFGGPLINQFSCTEEGPDGFDDLIFKIPTSLLNCLSDGTLASLTIDGFLNDGTPFTGFDLGFVINKQGC